MPNLQGYRPDGPRPYKPLLAGPCYDCDGNHWIRDCPNRRNKSNIQPLNRFCEDCGTKHLVQDCPSNPKVKGEGFYQLHRDSTTH